MLTTSLPGKLVPLHFVPILGDRALYIGTQRSIYRMLHTQIQAHRRGQAQPTQEPRPIKGLRAAAPNQF
jgi:hypothetical protein